MPRSLTLGAIFLDQQVIVEEPDLFGIKQPRGRSCQRGVAQEVLVFRDPGEVAEVFEEAGAGQARRSHHLEQRAGALDVLLDASTEQRDVVGAEQRPDHHASILPVFGHDFRGDPGVDNLGNLTTSSGKIKKAHVSWINKNTTPRQKVCQVGTFFKEGNNL